MINKFSHTRWASRILEFVRVGGIYSYGTRTKSMHAFRSCGGVKSPSTKKLKHFVSAPSQNTLISRHSQILRLPLTASNTSKEYRKIIPLSKAKRYKYQIYETKKGKFKIIPCSKTKVKQIKIEQKKGRK